MLKVILLGDGGVGKTCLINRYINNEFDTRCFHTIGVEFLSKDIAIGGKMVTLQIWDTAGQERFKSLRTPFYRGADCCILTFSLNSEESFKNLALWKSEFIHYADVADVESFPFVVLGNKVDLPQEREVSSDEASEWCQKQGILYFETSAKSAVNVNLAFKEAVKKTLDADALVNRPFETETVDLNKKSRRFSCC